MTITTFLILSLATWRVVSLICNEAGPFHVFKRVRALAERWDRGSRLCHEFGLQKLLTCEWCCSVYVGALVAALYSLTGEIPLWMIVPLALALSAATVIVKYVVHLLMNAESYLHEKERGRSRYQIMEDYAWRHQRPEG